MHAHSSWLWQWPRSTVGRRRLWSCGGLVASATFVELVRCFVSRKTVIKRRTRISVPKPGNKACYTRFGVGR